MKVWCVVLSVLGSEEIKGNKECKYVYIILNKGIIDKL